MTRPARRGPRRPAMYLMLCLTCGCAPTGGSGQLTVEDLAAIRRANLAYPAAWLSNDPEQVRATLTDDAVLMPSGGMAPVEGLSAIDEFFWPADAPPSTVTVFTMDPREVAGTSSVAYARGAMTLTFDTASDTGTETYTTTGTYLMILRPTSDGAWRIARYTWNHPPWELVATETQSADRSRSDGPVPPLPAIRPAIRSGRRLIRDRVTVAPSIGGREAIARGRVDHHGRRAARHAERTRLDDLVTASAELLEDIL